MHKKDFWDLEIQVSWVVRGFCKSYSCRGSKIQFFFYVYSFLTTRKLIFFLEPYPLTHFLMDSLETSDGFF